jgi:hypothetical protein
MHDLYGFKNICSRSSRRSRFVVSIRRRTTCRVAPSQAVSREPPALSSRLASVHARRCALDLWSMGRVGSSGIGPCYVSPCRGGRTEFSVETGGGDVEDSSDRWGARDTGRSLRSLRHPAEHTLFGRRFPALEAGLGITGSPRRTSLSRMNSASASSSKPPRVAE